MPQDSRGQSALIILCFVSLAIAAVMALLALIGWLAGLLPLAQLFGDSIAMAPSTALVIVCLIAATAAGLAAKDSRIARVAKWASAALAATMLFPIIAGQVTGTSLGIEPLLASYAKLRAATFKGFPTGQMSPVTAIALVSFFAGLLVTWTRAEFGETARRYDFPVTIGFLLVIFAVLACIAYVYGKPFFYDSPIIPPALPTAVAIGFMGVALFSIAEKRSRAIRWIRGPQIEAKIAIAFIPTILILFVIEAFVDAIHESAFHDANILAWNTTQTLGAILISAPTIIILSRYVGKRLGKAEEERKQTEKKFQTITESANDAIVQIDETGRVTYWNKAATRTFGWSHQEAVGQLIDQIIIPLNMRGAHKSAFQHYQGTGTGAAISNTIEFTALNREGLEFPVELSLSALKQGNGWGAVGLIRDISERKNAEEIITQSIEAIRISLDGTIEALIRVIEIRDPYTAGHQRGVARYAASLAASLGLSEEEIGFVKTAALVHDLGKIRVPAEILSKPSLLNPTEWEMAKTHCAAGHEILEPIIFPYPIAQVALQHHERMDGSGYPYGISGDEILLPSRIVAVADVLDGMTSHRPYRPALTMREALIEITSNSGVKYDLEVARAAERLFSEAVR